MEDIYISRKKQSSEPFEVHLFDEPPVPPQIPEEPPKKKKRKKHGFLRLIAVVLVVSLLLSSAFIFLFASASGYTRNDIEENTYVKSSSLKSNPLVTNILLLGVDGSADSASRSDTMILVSIDFVHGKIKLTSFLRDSWVYIPSKERNGKLNSACTYGGPQLVIDTLEYNFGVDIEHYVMVDFDMFTQIIDSLGGVDVEVTEKEAKFINRTTRHTVESGESVHLDGAKALVYCRIRKLDSDYMRTYRQRKVITSLIGQVKTAGIPKLISTLKDVFPLIETDMSPAEITGLAYKGAAGIVAFDIEQTRVPIDEHMSPDTINGQWVETLDIDATADYLQEFIYTDNIEIDKDD
jgi:LCP family protein required for cell wall assembly